MSLLASPAVLVALVGGIVTVAVQLTKLQAGQDGIHKELTGVKEELQAGQDGIHKELTGVKEELQAGQDGIHKELTGVKEELKVGLANISDVLAGVQRQGRSLARGVREAAPDTTAFACASPEEVEAWLVRIGYGHCAQKLRPLRGCGVLLQTEASLAALGIEATDCKLLMEHICALQ